MTTCTHESQIHEVRATGDGCEECLKSGDKWLHLRLCMECGHVGCCDDSKNHHATKHYESTNHPIMKSFEPGEDWGWCFPDELLLERDWPIRGRRNHSPAANAHLDY